jgi:hypothetical protein
MEILDSRRWSGGYSPPISAHILLHGERFKVGSLGPNRLVLQDPRPMDPGVATLHFTIDGNLRISQLNLIEGIDPARQVQPFIEVKGDSEAVA